MSSEMETPKEQILYANILFYGCWLGILIMIVTYFLYVFGIMEPHVPLQRISQCWSEPVGKYVEGFHIPLGWGWLALLGKGDFLNFVGIVLLAGLTIVCFLTLIPAYVAQKRWVFVFIAIVEALVLILAASGILVTGGH
ncbi:MAG: DUF1634 domain-containing protein [Thermodesulfobacteriota bacterium]